MTVDPAVFARGLDLKLCNGYRVAAFYCLGMSCLVYLISCWLTSRLFVSPFQCCNKHAYTNYYTLLQESLAILLTDNKLPTQHRIEVP